MKLHRLPIARYLVVALAAIGLVVGFSAASVAIDFGAAPGAHDETPADPAAPAAEGTPTPVAQAEPVEVDEALLVAGLAVYKEAGCRGCHGWAANGVREGPNPEGPSLRDTLLPMDAIRLTVACGRPGTPMPYFWRDAYRRDSTVCFGQTAAELGDLVPNRANVRFNDEELDALAYYLEYFVKGLGEISREQCMFYWDDAARCEAYPPEADL